MTEPFLGQIIQGGWNFAPRGYAYCSGQTMPIAQNTALFSLLGTTYGGNGQTTFGLPDLRGRSMVSVGQGPGLQDYSLGEVIGTENTTLTINNMPQHNHSATFTSTSTMSAAATAATQQGPQANGAVLGRAKDTSTNGTSLPAIYCPAGTDPTITLGGLNVAGSVTVGINGGSQPFSILNPLLVVSVVIALQGIFPTRN